MSSTDKKTKSDYPAAKALSGHPMANPDDVVAMIRDVLEHEAAAITSVAGTLGESVVNSARLLSECRGRVVVTGMGKMGCIARKAAATFSSTGTPSIFLHPGEAIHGDLGGVTPDDVLIALSGSGETGEVLELLPYMQRFDVPVIAITGNENSSLSARSNVTIDVAVESEADPDSLAPTSSTTVTLAMCDALAVCLMRARGFTPEQFAVFHPGGNLGRRLLLTVKDLMHVGDCLPVVQANDTLREAILTISEKRLGAAIVTDGANMLTGILTDGDLRRAFHEHADPLEQTVEAAMTRNPVCIESGALAAKALRVMQERSITVLPVVDIVPPSDEQRTSKPTGILHLHDLIRAGLV